MGPPLNDIGDAGIRSITRGQCPTCSKRGFIIGPLGGAAINIECANLECRARFNAVFFGGRCLMAEKIQRESEGGSIWPSKPSDPHGEHKGTFS